MDENFSIIFGKLYSKKGLTTNFFLFLLFLDPGLENVDQRSRRKIAFAYVMYFKLLILNFSVQRPAWIGGGEG
jgi:hypothetical protein